MTLTSEELSGLGVALNEATLLGVEVDPTRRLAGLALAVLSLPIQGPPNQDPRVQLLLSPVGRVCAVRFVEDAVQLLTIDQLHQAVQDFDGCPIYGWEFLDTPFTEPEHVSLDLTFPGPGGRSHSLAVFQEASAKGRLDLRIWFDALTVHTPAGDLVSLADFIAGGRRWWDALDTGDPRTAGRGIISLKRRGG
jgi:hypothetical protein